MSEGSEDAPQVSTSAAPLKQNEHACQACRAGKRRCEIADVPFGSGEPGASTSAGTVARPPCVRCLARGKPCVYDELKKRGRPRNLARDVPAKKVANDANAPSAFTSASTSAQASTSASAPAADVSPTSTSDSSMTARGKRSTGSLSLRRILEASRQVEDAEADAPSLAHAFVPQTSTTPSRQFEDVVTAGILPEDIVDDLFLHYHEHLNPLTGLLDRDLHTPAYVRQKSAILFTTVLAVATKVALSNLYPPVLKYVRSLLGQAFEYGTNDVELVQALALYSFWAPPTDGTALRKLSYAIRSAIELGLERHAKRPLGSDVRETLNRERTWLFLTVLDHRFTTQRKRPRMIADEHRADPMPWLLEHTPVGSVSQDAVNVGLVQFSRLVDLFDVAVSPDDATSLRLLAHFEREAQDWREAWLGVAAPIKPHPAQAALFRCYHGILLFEHSEAQLYLAIKRSTEPALAFSKSVKAATSALDVITREIDAMHFAYDTMWVGGSSLAVWLAQNSSALEEAQASLAGFRDVAARCAEGPQQIAGYVLRMLDSLLARENLTVAVAPHVTASLGVPAWYGAGVHEAPASIIPDLGAPSGDGFLATMQPFDDALWSSLFPLLGQT